MAQADNEKGAVLAGPLLGAHWYPKNTSDAVYPGDFVQVAATGLVGRAAAGNIELLGMVLSFEPAADNEVLVADDADQKYYIIAVGTTLAATRVGNNIDLTTTVGSSTYLRSNFVLDPASITSASAQMRILDKHPDDAWGVNRVRILSVINEHAFAKKTAGI